MNQASDKTFMPIVTPLGFLPLLESHIFTEAGHAPLGPDTTAKAIMKHLFHKNKKQEP